MVAASEKDQEIKTNEPRAFRWTVAEYYKIYNRGIFGERRVELIDGVIRELPYVNDQIWPTLILVPEALRKVFGEDYRVGSRIPLLIDKVSEPEPYFMVMDAAEAVSKAKALKHTALVVEVADAFFPYYRNTKAELYARANVPEYWILNLKTRELEVLRTPIDGIYTEKAMIDENQSVTPLGAPKTKIAVKKMLP